MLFSKSSIYTLKELGSAVPPLLARVSSSPASVKSGLDIYEDDDISIGVKIAATLSSILLFILTNALAYIRYQ